MKIRTGFVSNSSSSSFTCAITDETVIVRDGEWCDGYQSGIAKCVNDHTFLTKFIDLNAKPASASEKIGDLLALISDEYGEIKTGLTQEEEEKCQNGLSENEADKLYDKANISALFDYYKKVDKNCDFARIEVPAFRCPICKFKKVEYNDVIKFLLVDKLGENATFEQAEKYILGELPPP